MGGECICRKADQSNLEISKGITSHEPSIITYYPTQSDIDFSHDNNGKIIEVVRQNSFELSRHIFNQLNEIRFSPMTYINNAKKYGMEGVFLKANSSLIKPEIIRWSDSKHKIFTSEANKQTAINLIEKNKYNSTIICHNIIGKCTKDEIVWEFLCSLSVKQQLRVMMGNYIHCIISVNEHVHYKNNAKRKEIQVLIALLEAKTSKNA